MTEWFDGEVLSHEEVTPGLVHVRVGAPPAVLGSFVQAGQFQKLSTDGGKTSGYFALANAPGEGTLEYLVRTASGAASLQLGALEAGHPVALGRAEGRGFPLEQADGHPLLLVAVGSGLAPMRSVLRTLARRHALAGQVSLYYGVNTPLDFPFSSELLAWERQGLTVVRSVTVPDAHWSGKTGFIQRHLEGPPLPADTVVFLVGQKAMIHEAKAVLSSRGLRAENLHLNH